MTCLGCGAAGALTYGYCERCVTKRMPVAAKPAPPPRAPAKPAPNVAREVAALAAEVAKLRDALAVERVKTDRLAALVAKPKRGTPSKQTLVAHCIAAAAAVCEVDPAAICAATRVPHLVRARHLAAWLMRQHAGMSFPAIGAALGGRDHTSAMHGIAKAAAMPDEVRAEATAELQRRRGGRPKPCAA